MDNEQERREPPIQEQERQGARAQEPAQAPVPEQPRQELPKGLIAQAKRIGSPLPAKLQGLRSFIIECKRVLRVTRKPDKQEFTTIVKISSIGMAVIGLVGFIVFYLKELIIESSGDDFKKVARLVRGR